MNTISSINSFSWKNASVPVNTWAYISSKLTKSITFNISGGTNYVSLANTVPYANTAVGINQVTPNTTFLQCLSGSSFLKTSDIASSSFTFYVKYQTRNFSLSTNVWNKQYPVIVFSRPFIYPTQAFTVSFLSTYPVVNVTYTISGVVTGDLTNASLNGNLNGYSNTLNYVSSATSKKTMTFTAGGVANTATFLSALYTVKVSGGVYWISTNGGESVQQPSLTFTSGGLYLFDQSDSSNVGNRLVLGTGVDTGTVSVVTNGTPGSANAYTLIDVSGTTSLYYFSSTTTGMGYYVPSYYLTSRSGATNYSSFQFPNSTNNFSNSNLVYYTSSLQTIINTYYKNNNRYVFNQSNYNFGSTNVGYRVADVALYPNITHPFYYSINGNVLALRINSSINTLPVNGNILINTVCLDQFSISCSQGMISNLFNFSSNTNSNTSQMNYYCSHYGFWDGPFTNASAPSQLLAKTQYITTGSKTIQSESGIYFDITFPFLYNLQTITILSDNVGVAPLKSYSVYGTISNTYAYAESPLNSSVYNTANSSYTFKGNIGLSLTGWVRITSLTNVTFNSITYNGTSHNGTSASITNNLLFNSYRINVTQVNAPGGQLRLSQIVLNGSIYTIPGVAVVT